MIKDLKSQNYIKYINIIYHHIYRLIKNRKLTIISSNIFINGLIKGFSIILFKNNKKNKI